MAALLKAARMGMAWAITLALSCTLAQASHCPTGLRATRALAANGEAEAQYQLGRMYEFGDRVRSDSAPEGERMANSQPQPALTASSQK